MAVIYTLVAYCCRVGTIVVNVRAGTGREGGLWVLHAGGQGGDGEWGR